MSPRYRLRPMVLEHDDETGMLWAGALPSGPIISLGGIAEIVLYVLEEQDEPLGVVDVLGRLREQLEELPEDAEEIIAGFLEDLDRVGLLETVPQDPDPRAPRRPPRKETDLP
ncbi:PqqD family peptide modification chaperone [Brachybacterium hainanense]|uniref:PqqD family peptide modification chaperone n=1 Tax=Brachybacterium hainanense TaxID=1541174 RepID=A0ABV6RFN0_9MICO